MARPNRVFYLCNELNFLVDNNKNIDQVKELFISALVSGFGPFPILSVTVVDNVATVDIGESCRLYPGVKISIDGTGDSEIDTWHEIQSIAGNTFTFNVETVNGAYTNGITLSYPSLGWSLLDRDSTRILIKSGNSGSMTHKMLIEFRKATDYAYSWLIVYKKVTDDSVTIADVKSFIPFDRDLTTYLYYDNAGSESGNRARWFFYGDDAFVNLGLSNIYYSFLNFQSIEQGGGLWAFTFGELKKSDFNVSSFILNGFPRAFNSYDQTVSMWSYCSCSMLYGPFQVDNSKVIYNSISEKSGYYSSYINDAYLNYQLIPANASGRGNFINLSNTKFIKSTRYSSINILNSTYDELGYVPGIYYLTKKPTADFVFTNSTLRKVTCLGKLQNRNVYLRAGTRVATGSSRMQNSVDDYSSNLYDLTGPIR